MDSMNATSGLPATSGAAQPRASAAQQPRNPKLWKAATDFQEVMLSQFTQAMRSTEKDNSLFEECPGRETFDQMFSDAIAHQMSQSGALGLNKTIYRAMGGTYENEAHPPSGVRSPAEAAGPHRTAGTASPQAALVSRSRGTAGTHLETPALRSPMAASKGGEKAE